jgi:hypothetical protein
MSPYLNDFSQVENFIMDTVSKQKDFVNRIFLALSPHHIVLDRENGIYKQTALLTSISEDCQM